MDTTNAPILAPSASLLDYALAYARNGFYVLPLNPGQKTPIVRFVPHGFKNATNAESKIRAWWQACPQANIGIACEKSDIIVIDIDCHPDKPDGRRTFAELQGGNALPPNSVRVRTASGGQHIYFRTEALGENERYVDGVKALGESVDVKHKGYVVAPPSSVGNSLYEFEGSQID